MSIEYESQCQNDVLEIIENNTQVVLRHCGGSHLLKYVTTTNLAELRFRTDSSIEKLGWIIRFTFIENFNASSDSSIESRVSLSAEPFICGSDEWRCNSTRRCINKAWLCDGIKDCDDSSDEDTIDGICKNQGISCSTSILPCKTGCILPEKYCGNITQCPNLKYQTILPSDVEPLNITRAGCGQQPIPNIAARKIVGGIVARRGSWPWMLSLRLNGMPFCGATIVTPNWAVTAAHCVYGKLQLSYWFLDAGRHTAGGNENTIQRFRLKRIVMHQGYSSGNMQNDIAMLQIEGQFQYNNYVQPACVVNSETAVGTKCFVTGWGRTMGTGGDGYLKQVDVPIVNKQTCNQWYGGRIYRGNVCAGYEQGQKDSCQGDSGGPLVCMPAGSKVHLLEGIVSWGDGCAQARKPGVYTSAAAFLPWMRQVLASS